LYKRSKILGHSKSGMGRRRKTSKTTNALFTTRIRRMFEKGGNWGKGGEQVARDIGNENVKTQQHADDQRTICGD